MFKVLLCIPPDYEYNYPPLATPALCAFLSHNCIDAIQIDLNLKYRDFLTKHICGSSISQEEKKILLKIILKKFFTERLKNRYYSDFLPRDNDGIFPTLPYDNNTNSSFYFAERLLSSTCLFQYLEDKKENAFLQFYEHDKILGFLEKEDIKLLGISITSPSQAIASLTLGLLVKKYLPNIHVNIGGQWPTLYRREILQKKELFSLFDSITIFEGETALYKLILALKEKRNHFLPNIIFKNSDSDTDKNYINEDMNFLPCPDFDGLPLDTYNASEGGKISLTYETSRGCYWSKCAYCVDLPLPKPSYRRKSPDLVVNDIKQLKTKYNVDYLLLSDPGLSPRQMSEISKKLIDEDVKINWWCMARLDNGFTKRVFELAAKAGLKKINFGFESASDYICNFLHKGNQKERSARIIRDCSKAGIEVDLQTMLGLPKETFKDGLDTIDFLITNREFISHVTFNIYYLTPENFIYKSPDKYGIEYEKISFLPFRFFIPFKNIDGMNKNEAYLLEKIYYSLLNKRGQTSGDRGVPKMKELLEFNLAQESIKIYYLYNKLSDEYIFIEDEKRKDKTS